MTGAGTGRERQDADWASWLAGTLERPLVMIDGAGPLGFARLGLEELGRRAGMRGWSTLDLLTRPLPAFFGLGIPDADVIEAYGKALSRVRPMGDSFSRWWPNFGPGVLAAFLGADAKPTRETVWFGLESPVDLRDWTPRLDRDNPWWRRVADLTGLAARTWGDKVLPGFTDLGGTLDVIASMRGTEALLFDLVDEPEAVESAARRVTALWLEAYDALWDLMEPAGRGSTSWAHVRSPGRTYMLQSDFSAMISPAMFERFVLPDVETCAAAIDDAFWHLDGRGELPHLDLLLSVRRLKGIQWIPGEGQPPPEKWLPVLERIRKAGKLCQLYVSAEGALEITRALGGKGFAFYVDEPMLPSRASAFLSAMEGEVRDTSVRPARRWPRRGPPRG